MEALKHPLTYDEQIHWLVSKGLIINDHDSAVEILSSVNYYRLINAYGLGLYDPSYAEKSRYQAGTSIEQIYELYRFDVILRQVLSAMLEKFEVEFRTKLAYHLANKYCATSYLRPELFENALHHEDFLKNFWRDKSSQSKSLIVKHHNEKYGGIIPIWAAVEIVSFGTLSKLYCNLNETDRKTFSLEHYEVKEWMLKSWLRSFVECRNICAHYGRLYNRILLSRPRLFNDMTGFNNQRIFPVLYLLARYEEDNATIYSACTRLRTAFTFFPSAECEKIGFPENWFQVITGFDLDSEIETEDLS